MELIEICVMPDYTRGDWMAYDIRKGIDYDWDGDSWKNCGSEIGTGKTIQEAIDSFLENFTSVIQYTWI